MIIKKLSMASGGRFPGAAYNERKVEEGLAELVSAANVNGNYLHELYAQHRVGLNCADSVERYLQDCSQTYGNTRSTKWQLHLALSCKGQEKTKEQLVDIAHALMKEYGYGKQPYFVYFHHDTDNNHIHILTTRITPIGTLMKDHNDYHELNAALNRVLGDDQKKDMERMVDYSFTTEGQFLNIARAFNYKVGESENDKDKLVFYHGGVPAFTVSRNYLETLMGKKRNNPKEQEMRENAVRRLKAIFIKYRELSLQQGKDTDVGGVKAGRAKSRKDLMKPKSVPDVRYLLHVDGTPLTCGERKQMNWFLSQIHSKLGIVIHFQKDKNGIVRGFSIIDHNNKVAVNGSEVMKLADLINFKEYLAGQQAKTRVPQATLPKLHVSRGGSHLDIYRSMLQTQVVSPHGDSLIQVSLDGKTYSHVLSDKQCDWYYHARAAEREDIAIKIAVYYFHREIYEHYLNKLMNQYINRGSLSMDIPKKCARLFKRKNGLWMLAVDMPNYSLRFELSKEESLSANRVAYNSEGKTALIEALLPMKLREEEAKAIARRLSYKNVGIRPDYSKDSQANINMVAKAHLQLMQRVFQIFTVRGGSRDENREFEVGHHSSYEDEIDDGRGMRI
jgi:hypothetical protein